ncbi:MAG: serine/threonine protein kinase [Myxococcales bacterium]|nr:serine/threonine protein kinase [Myxococcales bacterium]
MVLQAMTRLNGQVMGTGSEGLVGQVLASRYAIDGRLGDGGMGTVYRARHVKMGRIFAIKILHRRLLANPKVVRRFAREAELAGRLGHPNVVGVVDVGETPDGLHYLVMEHAPGKSLATLIEQESPMPAERVIELARQLCDGLQHAHDVGLIHRDFKPENVIVDRDAHGHETPRIVDFGIAIVREDVGDSSDPNERLTTAGLIIGTPHYMAPEQARGEALDHRADLFALGLILYEMLTGRLPFEGTGVDIARANSFSKTPPMGVRVPTVQVDPLLEQLVHKLLAKTRDNRPPTAAAVRELLDMIEHHRGAAAKALGVPMPELPRAPKASEPPYSHEDKLVLGIQPTQHIATRDLVAQPTQDLPLEDLVLIPPRPLRRKHVALAAGALAIALLIVVLALHGRGQPASAPVIALADASVSLEEPSIATRDDRILDVPVPAGPVDAGVTALKPAPRPRPPAGTGSAAPKSPTLPEAPTATVLAGLYGSVGRQLKALDAAKGDDATIDLWPRYRWIRINESLVTADKRRDAADMLTKLREDIAARAK